MPDNTNTFENLTQSSASAAGDNYEQYLKRIDENIKKIVEGGVKLSQSDAINQMKGESSNKWKPARSSHKRGFAGFEQGFDDAMMEAFLGAGFKDKIKDSLSDFADMIGVELKDVPHALGKELGQAVAKNLKNTRAGQAVFNQFNRFTSNAAARFMSGVSKYDISHGTATAARFASLGSQAARGAATSQAAVNAVAAGDAMGALFSGLSSAVGPFVKYIGPVGVGLAAANIALKKFGPAIEGAQKLFKSMSKAWNRYETSRKANIELAQKRLAEDVRTMVEEPFNILKEAAQSIYSTWDNNLRTITATQGYSKSDMQSLMSAYSQRLKAEGLYSVVSSSDMTSNLAKVLESGLSGTVAEEFSYIATKLGAAIPTQDFFSYASAYSSLAANAIKNGKSQTEAIQYANEQMELFASNILYASRQVSGGFSTGLRDASSLFQNAIQIATAAKGGTPAQISSVLTAVAAATGAIAPDLATSMVDAVVRAATGGNAAEIVSLRSLAGINASNTEFLKALAQDPQKIFTNLFKNLANMQNMSNENFMEVAEGLSSVFGLSMSEFARIDFNYLADAISSMSVNTASLDENIRLLQSGETTTSAEQMKIAQINKYMLDEGLAYVLDNQAARSIQEHMWDEQIARDLMEATYGVELKGAGLEFLEGIKTTVTNILNFFNPAAWFRKAANLTATYFEGEAQVRDIKNMLELGKVGSGNARALSNLTTRGTSLNLTPDLISLMGGFSEYNVISNARNTFNSIANSRNLMYGVAEEILKGISTSVSSATSSNIRNSKYSWGMVGKSVARLTRSTASPLSAIISSDSSTQLAQAQANSKFSNFLTTMSGALSSGMSYDEWLKTASQYGIRDIDAAMSQYGLSETKLKSQWQAEEVALGNLKQQERYANEENFWERSINYFDTTFVDYYQEMSEMFAFSNDTLARLTERAINYYDTSFIDYNSMMKEFFTYNNRVLDEFFAKHSSFYDAWVDYYVNHTAYSEATLHAYDVAGIRSAERQSSGDAILALAEALTSNAVDMRDPQVQTNALLAKILLVAEAIMQQNNTASKGLSLPDSLSALALGMTQATII